MDRNTLEGQIANLNSMKLQQQARLENARKEINGATATLERIEGGLEICRWMLEQLLPPANTHGEANGEITVLGRVGMNGQLEDVTIEKP